MINDFLAGAISGSLGIALSHPINTIQVRYQTRTDARRINFTHLYRGVTPPLIGMALEKAVVFSVYERIKLKTSSDVLGGLGAGFVCATLITTPIEHIKTNMQLRGSFH